MQMATILPAFLVCGCENWSLTFRNEHRVMVVEKREPKKILFGRQSEELA
jgi:hypothetical protein